MTMDEFGHLFSLEDELYCSLAYCACSVRVSNKARSDAMLSRRVPQTR